MKWPALFFYCERASFSKLERIVEALLTRFLNSFRREPQLAVVACIGVIIAYLSLSPTLMLFYGSFRSKPLGVPNTVRRRRTQWGNGAVSVAEWTGVLLSTVLQLAGMRGNVVHVIARGADSAHVTRGLPTDYALRRTDDPWPGR